MKTRTPALLIVLVVLSIEKFIQHMFVTYALYANVGGIRESVVVNYRILIVSGFIVGILFLASIPLVLQKKRAGFYLLLFLGLFDLIGEFIAQGTVFIKIPLSFIVASLIVILLIYGRGQFGQTPSTN